VPMTWTPNSGYSGTDSPAISTKQAANHQCASNARHFARCFQACWDAGGGSLFTPFYALSGPPEVAVEQSAPANLRAKCRRTVVFMIAKKP